MKSWFFEVVLVTLALLVGVAIWQFYSLTWGDGARGGYTAGRGEPAYQTTPAARPLTK